MTRQHDTPKGDTWCDSVTVTEAARLLGVSVRTVQRRLDNGDLRAIERDGKRFVAMTPDATADTTQGDSATRQTATDDATRDMTGDWSTPTLLDQLRDENAFLRAQVDAWRLQAEAANRTASETAAALREALKAMPKAITEGGSVSAFAEPEKPPKMATGDQTAADGKQSPQTQRKPRELTAWQKVIARITGIR